MQISKPVSGSRTQLCFSLKEVISQLSWGYQARDNKQEVTSRGGQTVTLIEWPWLDASPRRVDKKVLPPCLISSYHKTCKNECRNNSEFKQSLIFLIMPIPTICSSHLPFSNYLRSHYLLTRFPSFITLWGHTADNR